jgi:hypothetical protein
MDNRIEYIDSLIQSITELEESSNPEYRMEERQFELFKEHLVRTCNDNYRKYLRGELDSYEITEQQYDDVYDESCLEYASEVLDNLVDMGFMEASVSETGEILYGAIDHNKNK